MKISELDILVQKSRVIRNELEFMITKVFENHEGVKGKLELILADVLKLQTDLERRRKTQIQKFIRGESSE
jgi:hypothetical protein